MPLLLCIEQPDNKTTNARQTALLKSALDGWPKCLFLEFHSSYNVRCLTFLNHLKGCKIRLSKSTDSSNDVKIKMNNRKRSINCGGCSS